MLDVRDGERPADLQTHCWECFWVVLVVLLSDGVDLKCLGRGKGRFEVGLGWSAGGEPFEGLGWILGLGFGFYVGYRVIFVLEYWSLLLDLG